MDSLFFYSVVINFCSFVMIIEILFEFKKLHK